MLFNEIVNSARPLEQLVRLALSTKGVTVTNGTVQRYSSLLEAAILADEGDALDGNVWQDFVNEIDGPSKYQGVIAAIGQTLDASSSEIQQFMAVSNAAIDALSGVPVDQAEQFLAQGDVVITQTGVDRYGRVLATVRRDDEDLGAALIAAGLARAWRGRRESWCD